MNIPIFSEYSLYISGIRWRTLIAKRKAPLNDIKSLKFLENFKLKNKTASPLKNAALNNIICIVISVMVFQQL